MPKLTLTATDPDGRFLEKVEIIDRSTTAVASQRVAAMDKLKAKHQRCYLFAEWDYGVDFVPSDEMKRLPRGKRNAGLHH